MKALLLLLFSLFISLTTVAQVDSLLTEKPLVDLDTLTKMPVELEEIYISNRYDFRSDEERKKFLLLKNEV